VIMMTTFAIWNSSNSHTSGNVACIKFASCLHMNWKALVTLNFNGLFETEGLLKVIASHVHCKCGNIAETVPDRVVVTTDH